MTSEIKDILENMTTAAPEMEDYIGEDGLLYCGKCHTPKEAYFPEGKELFGRDRHPAECDCQRTAREEREAAEKRRRHLDTVEELKRRGFTDPTMRDWTFENDNGRNPQTGLARRYVEHWEDMRTDNIGCLFWGGVGTGKSYLAGCIANALMEKEIPVRMTNFALILNDLAASFEGRNEYISRLCRYPLLILDDFGMERGTEYGLEQVFNVIDSRYRSGKPIKGRIIATRPGHTVNNKFARLMRKEIRKHEIQAPIYDPNEEPIMDNIRIRQLLPHRYPMQLVDKVIAMGPNSIVGVKNVTSNEPFFTGHFPEEPVMPGVLQVEAMAQCGGLLVLNQLEEPERWSTYFMKLDDVKFRKKVVPGDTLLFRVELLAPVRHGISSMKGYMFVGDQVVAEATFTAQIVKNK